MTSIPAYQGTGDTPGSMTCPKCLGNMRTVDRNGVHIEQCLNCRGVFLDFGELEHITKLETTMFQQPPIQDSYGHGPGWGYYGDRRYRRGGLASLFFSS